MRLPNTSSPRSIICRKPRRRRSKGGQQRVIIAVCWSGAMTQDEVKAILDRVLTWPRERQEDVIEIIASMKAQDTSEYRLTNERVAEVRRALADGTEPSLTLKELD